MDKFKQLFAKAEIVGLIEQNKVSKQLSPLLAAQSLRMMREYDITQYCIEFRTYLNESEVSFETDKDFAAYCEQESTFDTFVKFLHYRKAETKKNIAEQAERIAKYSPNEQLHIAMDILGLTTGENNFNPVQPVFYYIDEVLIKHNLTPKQAKKILEDHTGGLPPATNKSLTKKVIKHLKKLDKYVNQTPPQQGKAKTDKLKVPQIALIHVYEGIQITRENAGEIAAKHGYTAKNSGEGLFQDYTNYFSTANRKGKPTLCTPKRLKNKIVLFESVVNHLSDNSKQRAIDEIMILKTIFENEYQ